MTILEQCQIWNEQNEFQKIIDALEAIPAGERTPEEDSELARAYNNLAGLEDKELFQKAIDLLSPHEKYFQGDHCWNFRMGYAYYYLEQEEPALYYFEKALAARPGDEDTKEFIEDCRFRLSLPVFETNVRQRTAEEWEALKEIESHSSAAGKPELYTGDEMEAIEYHIERYFGKCENVFHELVSPDIHVDICLVPPDDGRDYYTLITMGMGAHRMNVPEELADYKLERAELAIALPSDWKLREEWLKEEQWYWPIRLLKGLARLPGQNDTWLGFGHTMDNKKSFAENTDLCAAILIEPQQVEDGAQVCRLPNGERVNFYQVIPLYREEMEYKIRYDVDQLLEKMGEISFIVQPNRPSAQELEEGEALCSTMDDAAWHLETIREKQLPIDEINVYNHMAIYLRWCMEHDLMSEAFLEEYSEWSDQVKKNPQSIDLRVLIRDGFQGQLFTTLFNRTGEVFSRYYYETGFSPCYSCDVDDYALQYFGRERYESEEFQNEAYLFVPFDEAYYRKMAKMIGERFEGWRS